jgi:hypothetical protein
VKEATRSIRALLDVTAPITFDPVGIAAVFCTANVPALVTGCEGTDVMETGTGLPTSFEISVEVGKLLTLTDPIAFVPAGIAVVF